MGEADDEERMLRRYLLGELGEAERERVEERFITDRDFGERVLVAEDALVEDYLDGSLPEAESELFAAHFLSTPEQRRKVRIAGSLKRHLTAATPPRPTEPGGEVRPPGVGVSGIRDTPFWHKPMILVPASAALILALVLGSIWLFGARQRWDDLAEARREIEQLNGQPASEGPRWEFLTPIAVRGGREANVIPRPAEGDPAARLWLLLVKDEYDSYQAVFGGDGGGDQFPVGGLRAQTTPRGRAIPVRIPTRLLGPGDYTLKLSGVADGGRAEEIGEYSFRVLP